MTYNVRVENVTSHRLAAVRRRVPRSELSKVVPHACGLVWGVVKAAHLPGAGRQVAIYRDGGGGIVEVEVGVEIGAPFAGQDEVVGSATPAGTVATVTHFGPYGVLGEAHEAIRRWSDLQGRKLAHVNWEVYGHWLPEWNNDPAKIRTDVFYLLAS